MTDSHSTERNDWHVFSPEKRMQIQNEFKKECSLIHGGFYDYSCTYYKKDSKGVRIFCPDHGFFRQKAYIHKMGIGCPRCELKEFSFDKFISLLKKIYQDKYNYDEVKIFRKRVIMNCHKNNHGEFDNKTTHKLVCGYDCPKCNQSSSNICLQWLEYVSKRDGVFIRHADNLGEFQIPNSKYMADGQAVLPNGKIKIYEFNGCLWHMCKVCFKEDEECRSEKFEAKKSKAYQRTIDKRQFIIDQGFEYEEIWEHDWRKFVESGGLDSQ